MVATTAVNVLAQVSANAASSALYGWGLNDHGQVGNGTTSGVLSPAELLQLPSGVTAVAGAAGADHSLVIGSDGNLYAWGNNTYGQLGDSSTTSSLTPVEVGLPSGVTATAVAAGQALSLALCSDGNVYAWGYNGFGELGNGTTAGSGKPVKVHMPSGVTATAVAAGAYTSFAIGSNGNVYAWGDGADGDLGNGVIGESDSVTPVEVSLPSGVVATSIAAGAYFGMAMGSKGSVYAWGDNANGELGDGNSVNSATPVTVGLPSGVTAKSITAGGYHAMAVSHSGALYVWGYNDYGQLGTGNTTSRVNPGEISVASGVTVTSIAAGEYHSLAIGSDGYLYAWGYNGDGELGNGTTSNASTPSQVGLPAKALPPTAIFAGSSASNSFAIASPSPIPTTTTLSASASSLTYGQTLSLNATVAPSDGGGTVTLVGNVTAIPGCTSVPLTLVGSSYQASCFVSSLVVGSYSLTALYSGDGGYASSSSAGTGLTITTAPLVVTASSGSYTYGGTAPPITASYSGFVNGDSASSLTTAPTCYTNADSTSPVGSYTSQCSGASDPNYTITYQNGAIGVTPAPLSITATSGTMTYGGSVAPITASYSGFVNGDSASSLTTAPTCSTNATSSSPVGSYTSSCAGAQDANYTISYSTGMVTIGQALLVITASSASMTYGSSSPAITPSYSGFVNGDSASSLTNVPACTSNAAATSSVGTYVSSCTGAVDPNYAITYQSGDVNVNPAPLTVTASSGMSAYGHAIPSVSPLVTGLQNGEDSSVLGSELQCSTTATTSSSVGTYDTSCAGAVDPNYTITYVDGTITITPAPLTITASSGTMTYGGTVPTVSPIFTGLENGEGPSVLGADLVCSTEVTTGSPVGTYGTTCFGAVDANYDINYVDGSITVTTAPLTITASSGTMTYGGTAPVISAIVAGLQNGEDASVLGDTLTCTSGAGSSSSVGDYATACSGAVDSNYDITYVSGSVSVSAAALVVTASSGTSTYGSPPPGVTASYAGFVNGDSASSLTAQPVCTTTATASSPVGNYATSCSGASDANYTITYVGGTLVVGTGSLVITASSPLTTYGSAPSAVTPAYAGFVNGDSASSLTAQPVCTTTATASSPVGNYATSCSGALDVNYNIVYVDGSATVNPAPLTITASSASTTYGGASPIITASYAGFVNGDDASSLSTAPSCSSPVTSVSPVGSYPSSCSGAVDPNYAITYSSGTAVVSPAPLTITAPSETSTYGSAIPALAPNVSGLQNGETPSVLGAGLNCSTLARSSSPVGAYQTSCSGATDANYSITYLSGSVQVTPASLSITASSGSATYGSAPPAVTASYAGFVNGDDASSLATQPVCNTFASSSSSVDTYATSCSGASDPNYSITYVSGSMQVTPAALVVTASSASSTYGDVPPQVLPSYSGFVNNDDSSALTVPPSCSTTAVTSSPIGTYPTSCSGASDPNYTITYENGSLKVTPAALSVVASSGTSTFGSPPPGIGPLFSGFVNGDSASSLTTQPTCSTTASASSPAGSYPSTCSGAYDPNYNENYVPGTVVVGQATLIVTASSGSFTYGGSVPHVTDSYSGFVNGDSASSLTTQPTCSTTASSSSHAGSYTTSCSGANDPNYNIVYVTGSITVDPAPLTITATSSSTTYGSAIPTVTASYSVFENGDRASSLTTQPNCTTSATSSSPVGTYTTSCSGASDPDYAIVYATGTATINPAPLSITASSATMTYGRTVPAITASVSGLVLGQTPSVLGAGLLCTTSATSTSNVGNYQSSCSGAVDANYAFTYVPGVVSVVPATLTVTANNQSMAYGSSVPALTATISGFVNGQTLATSGVTGSPSCATTATPTSAAGTYPILCSTGTLAAVNYTFTFVAGTLTVTSSETRICDYIGVLNVSGGQSVLVPWGCFVLGAVTVKTGGSLDVEGGLIAGAVNFSGGSILRFCSATFLGLLSVSNASNPVVIGDGTSSCEGSAMALAASISSNTAGVSVQNCRALGAVSVNQNQGGAKVEGCDLGGYLAVEQNSGGVTVTNNSVFGDLTVTGNTGTVVDHPNTVFGHQHLQ